MAITLALTASNATPNQEDLPESITVSATATDSDDGAAVFAFSWHFLGKPPSTTAALLNPRAASTTFSADLWGSYRLFCIAQNTTSGATSIVDPLAAPSSSFLDIEVLSTNHDLVKPAKTQREWQGRYWELVEVVENLTPNSSNASTTVKGVVELANELEAATAAGSSDSSTGADFCISPEVLVTVLGSNNANGNLPSSTVNVLRNTVKTAALEKMNEVSITELADVDTTTNAPTAGQVLVWDATAADDSGDNDTGAWVPGSMLTGDITAVTAGTGLTGGGTSGAVTLNVAGLTVAELAAGSLQISSESFVDDDTSLMTSAAIKDLIDANVGSGAASVGDARDIQLSDGSGAFLESNWQVSTGDDFIPVTDNAFDVGSSTKRVRKLRAYDAKFYDDVAIDDDLTVSGTATVIENIVLQDHALLGDNGSAGTLLFTAGSNGVLAGNITNSADETIIKAETSGTEAKLSLQNSAASKVSLITQQKQSVTHVIELPSEGGTTGDVVYVTDHGSGETELEFRKPTQRMAYTGFASIDGVAASFSGSNMASYATAEQACVYWVKNNSGKTITWKSAHIHVGHMMNATLDFALCKAASDAAVLANTWTLVGSAFTITNNSGSDNTLGQAQNSVYITQTIAAGEYLGITCTNIPQASRDDKKISISFEAEKDLDYA